MSQNKTKVPGMDGAQNANFNSTNNAGAPNGFYQSNKQTNSRGTVFPGMNNGKNAEDKPGQKSANAQVGKPIVGFLYSISRTPLGEFWPLKIGPNSIGIDNGNDIVLPEGTVSGKHAVIVIRQIKNTGNIIAAITDTQSTNGTMINGETIGFSAVECNSGDVITIGNNYELVLILVDPAKLNLSVSADFIQMETDDEYDYMSNQDNSNNFSHKTNPGGFKPFDNTEPWNNGGFTPNDGTVGMDGAAQGYNKGGTKPM